MAKIGVFYGSTTGHTQEVVENVISKLSDAGLEVDLFDVSKASKDDLTKYENLILASSTYGDGDLQTDWEDFANDLCEDDFDNKVVAIIGLGDQDSYSDTFCDSIGILANLAKKATLIGKTKNSNYEFEASKSLEGDEFLGLVLDEDNQSDLTEERISNWVNEVKDKFK